MLINRRTFTVSGLGAVGLAALGRSALAAGVRALQSIDAMAVIHMVTSMIWPLIALRFVNPTQIVARSRGEPAK